MKETLRRKIKASFLGIFFVSLLFGSKSTIKQEPKQVKQESEEKATIVANDNEFVMTPNTVDYEQMEKIETETIIKEAQDKIANLDKSNLQKWFKKYKKITKEYSDYIDPPESIYDCYSSTEISYMQRCIETETYQADFESKTHVASVILNRINSKEWSNDPIEIVTSKNQFAYGRTNITKSTKLALEYSFMIEDTAQGCIGFRSDCSPMEWNGWNYIFTDKCGHNFYK